jgi:predicted nucleotide-binding protein (sugar kinase/HSP70/actin superfamily)
LIYANNEVCYPATLVVGDIIKALQSGQYDLNKIAIGISQTGGQCRATNYLALIKRALTLAGYDNVPVVAVAPSSGLVNEQPGFDMKWRKVILPMLSTMLFSDAVSRMYYATVCRETHKGTSASLRRTYIDKAIALIDAGKHGDMLKLLKNAVLDFNKISVHDKPVTAVGVVGEIYVKYNSFGHAGIVEWLIDNGVEAVLPSLQNFFLQSFVNSEENRKLNIERSSWTDGLMKVVEWLVKAKIKWYEKALSAFRFYRPAEDIRDCAEAAKKVASLVHQYGEGWLIPAEVANFLRLGINDVICLQPFGCIANHVIGKGIEKKIRNLYPDMNILFLDLDYGASRINLLNRLQFLVQNS